MPFFKRTFISLLSALLALGFLFFWLQLAWNDARLAQQAKVIETNAFAVGRGLEYFYFDNDRFPQSAEFQNGASLPPYFSAFPPQGFVSKICPQGSFFYVRPALSQFDLNFCVPVKTQKSKAGWNKITNSRGL